MDDKRIEFWNDLDWLRRQGFIVSNIRLLTISMEPGCIFGDLVNDFIKAEKRFNPDWKVCLTILLAVVRNADTPGFPCPEHIIGEQFDFERRAHKDICFNAFDRIKSVKETISRWSENLEFESNKDYNFLVNRLCDTAWLLIRKNLLHRYK